MIPFTANDLLSLIQPHLAPLLAICGILVICYGLYRLARSPRRGGGSATIFFVGTTDALRNMDQRTAAEIIVRQQTGDRLKEEERGGAGK
ncbi:MAG: hypothetical protein F4Z81_04705 [Gemmatimonadetes bacterium]|nr:hypothetical protein [Gemmatimonadota bacterium]MYB60345.1 hypothetical protein [Gemmatimonadota bacterium]